MERLSFIRAQPWFEEEDAASAHVPPLRTQEHTFASHEIFEGLATFLLASDTDGDEEGDETQRRGAGHHHQQLTDEQTP